MTGDQVFDVTCPHCGRTNNFHSDIDGQATPAPGDMSVCWKCRRVGVYAEDLSIRKPTVSEQNEIDADGGVKRALAAMTESNYPAEALRLTRHK